MIDATIGQQGQSSKGGSNFEARGDWGGDKNGVPGGGTQILARGGEGGIVESSGQIWQIF